MCEISTIIVLICQKIGSVGPVQQKIKLPSPKQLLTFTKFENLETTIQINTLQFLLTNTWKFANQQTHLCKSHEQKN